MEKFLDGKVAVVTGAGQGTRCDMWVSTVQIRGISSLYFRIIAWPETRGAGTGRPAMSLFATIALRGIVPAPILDRSGAS
jgi:hypothetical protein